jgi:hypothetical protein
MVKTTTALKLATTWALTTFALVVGLAGSSSGATPEALPTMMRAFLNADQQGWVHEVQISRTGTATITMVDDIGASEGRQITTFSNGGHDTLIALDAQRRMYEKANAAGLLDYQITSNTKYYADKWLVQTPKNTGYANNAEATTLLSDFAQYYLAGPLKIGRVTKRAGELVRVITGKAPKALSISNARAWLYVSATGLELPVALVVKGKDSTYDVSWNAWGKKVVLRAPRKTTPYPSPTVSSPQTSIQ